MKQRILAVAAVGLTSLMLGGCPAPVIDDDQQGAQVEDHSIGAGGTTADGGVVATGGAMEGTFSGSPLDDPASPLSQRVFYFDYDSSELSQSDRAAIDAHARFLLENPQVSVVVEGHADERGSREYNLALGERRAQAVERMLTLQGVSSLQLQVISFGEERPVAMGHDDEAWRVNRRVELLYSGY